MIYEGDICLHILCLLLWPNGRTSHVLSQSTEAAKVTIRLTREYQIEYQEYHREEEGVKCKNGRRRC